MTLVEQTSSSAIAFPVAEFTRNSGFPERISELLVVSFKGGDGRAGTCLLEQYLAWIARPLTRLNSLEHLGQGTISGNSTCLVLHVGVRLKEFFFLALVRGVEAGGAKV